MQAKGLKPNTTTYNSLIGGFCKVGKVSEAKDLSKDMLACGLCNNDRFAAWKPDIVVYSIILDGMCKTGQLFEAKELFDSLLTKDLRPDVDI
ncbi:hypothetical protein AQUCO_00400184v1 [Aquilegia coerulea]|uniref:Pentatricopeptide repeat-containing protein n=1 Tax=Aquilegia coerulea TaxID=218851 RepID=A0A2G5ETR5_AQUCA|nr:hypothetical protein AQUCO_00400184v1 [Aquilegia coerulea]